MAACKYGDALCPCQDGDQCHYEGMNPMTPPRPAALEEAAVIADDWGDAREPARGGDALKNCAVDIRAAITKVAKP